MLYNKKFNRIFSLNMRKNKSFSLSSMTFSSDFVNGENGNMYPVLESNGIFSETLSGGKYIFSAESETAFVSRYFARFFPYASYEFTAKDLRGVCGFSVINESGNAKLLFGVKNGKIYCKYGASVVDTDISFTSGTSFFISFRGNEADAYVKQEGFAHYITTFTLTDFDNILYHDNYSKTDVAFFLSGDNTTVTDVCEYIDCGISQADIRPIKYEDGSVLIENGKMYFTISCRLEAEHYQGVFSWIPGTNEFDMTGAVFFDSGDGICGNDIATSLKYNRKTNEWYLWVCSFTHNHVLGHASFKGDIRFGKHIVDLTLMDKATDKNSIFDFVGFEGDEDPDFIYDDKNDRWLMTFCRLVNGKYSYFLFESQNPFEGYKNITMTLNGQETGGSIVPFGGEYYFVCGNSFSAKSEYRIYKLPDMNSYKPITCDYIDGGFRGWGTIFTIESGTRTKLYWLTFDRYKASKYNWSYGNIYCYEAE